MPIPEFIRKELRVGDSDDNVFSGRPIEFNDDYFKTLWSRLKRRIQRLESKVLSTHLDILALLKSLNAQAQYTSYKERWGIQV